MEVGLAIFFLAVVVKGYFHIKNGGKVFEFMTPEELQEHRDLDIGKPYDARDEAYGYDRNR